jgi:hypothetical protein
VQPFRLNDDVLRCLRSENPSPQRISCPSPPGDRSLEVLVTSGPGQPAVAMPAIAARVSGPVTTLTKI